MAKIAPPPQDPLDLVGWAQGLGIGARLDDVLIGSDGPWGTWLPGRGEGPLTYRQILIERVLAEPDAEPGRFVRSRLRDLDREATARRYLHRIARLAAAARRARAWLDEHGRDPEDEVLLMFLARLRTAARELRAADTGAGRPWGTYQPRPVQPVGAPLPLLQYQEWPLVGAGGDGREDEDEDDDGDAGDDPAEPRAPARGAERRKPLPDLGLGETLALDLLGWNDGPADAEESWRWSYTRGRTVVATAPSPGQRLAALDAFIDLVRDPRALAAQETLGELLRLPAWQIALGNLDERLARLEAEAELGSRPGKVERVAFRVTVSPIGIFDVEPVIQKRGRGGGFSWGSKFPWYNLAERPDLTAADRRAYQAYDDRFARRSFGWAGGLSPAQVFGVLRALIDHPAVFFDSGRDPEAKPDRSGARLDIRAGRLQLRFVSGKDAILAPQFELLGVTLLAADVAQGLRDDRHFIHLHRSESGGLQVLLAQLSPQAGAVVHALALAPARFPPEAHDALAARLEPLQEVMDIEFPSQWTRTIAPADARLLARLELLASGAVQVRLALRPVKLGPVFAPGEGPALVLEGQGRDRHGARRDRHAERLAARALAERLNLESGAEIEPWCWRVGEGDPALRLVAALKEMGDQVVVEWANDGRLVSLGSVGRRDMRMQVGDRRDWFAVQGGAQVGGTIVRLSDLLAAIREDRRYVLVGQRGFVAIEESLRQALARAEGAVFESHDVIQIAPVASDPLVGLVEHESQIEASAAFATLRRRIKEGSSDHPRLSDQMQARLRPYQKAGVAWLVQLAHWGAGAILADEMGLGKTVQTLAVLSHRAAAGPALVVAPTSVVANWVDEAARFAPELRLRLYRGPDRAGGLRGLGPGDLVVTSYSIATGDAEALAKVSFGSLVLDEAQAVKNAGTERSKALRGLDAGWRLALTGTPIENHLAELWSILRIVSPGLLGSWEQFRGRYAQPIEKFGDLRRRQSLANLVRPFILRRTKTEVAPELPPCTEIVRSLRLSPEEQALYEELRKSTMDELAARKKDRDRDASDMRFELLAALTRMRQLCCHPRLVYPRSKAGSSKATHLLELLEELREGEHRALVFSQFRSFLDLLAPRLRQHGLRVLVLDGTTPAELREQRVAAFQRGEADVFLISLKAGGFGLNLTAADTVIHLDPWWNPAVEDQATARAHRIGQNRPVTAVRLVARDTIEEAVLELHADKRALAAGVLDGSDIAARLGTEELMELIQRGPTGKPAAAGRQRPARERDRD